jgi:putative ABC transport system permease protein
MPDATLVGGGAMNLFTIVRRSLRQHALSTIVTAASVALAGGLLMSVWVVKQQSQATFTGVNGGFDAVLGARGSKLQLVLNAIFHLEASPGNLAWQDYLDIQNNPEVELAVPLAVGDNYRGSRLVGTTPELFAKSEYAPGKRFELQPGGDWLDPERREAVVGDFAARQLGLKVGDQFHPFHGLVYDDRNQHAETYIVVGVLKPSNTPADRVIWIPLAGIQMMGGHDPNAATDVSAVLVKLKSGAALSGFQLDLLYNKQGNKLTFAWPIGAVMADLFDKIGWFDRVLTLVSYLVALVAAGSILASIYNSMNERRRELAILRALGARRGMVFSAIVLESASIAALGVAAGFVIYAVLMFVVAGIMRAQTGVVLEPFKFNLVMLWSPALFIALGALAGIVPALKAYRTDVASNLTPHS